MKHRINKLLSTVAVVALLTTGSIVASDLASAQGTIVGQTVSGGITIDGLTVPSGTSILSRSVLETSSHSGLLQLRYGQTLELLANSSAYVERARDDRDDKVKLMVRSGLVSFKGEDGDPTAVPDGGELIFSSEAAGMPVTPLVKGVVAVLMADAAAGSKALTVNDGSRIDPKQSILVSNRNRKVQEIHYVESIDGKTVKMTAPLAIPFPDQALVIQGPEVQKALAAGVVIAGVAAKAAISGGLLGSMAAGLAGTGLGIGLAVTSSSDEPSSPYTETDGEIISPVTKR